ncbi:hypothetical protein ACIG0A_33175 [Streptomyces californicus]|uniref:hypothetical protein n=1 Tax=Streptomyces californicus TaxID=67351 RepID=UPI0037D71FCE
MDIGRELASLRKQVQDLQRSARLSSASLDDTALLVRDGTGSLRGIVGQQGDGTTAVTIVNGPPPPQPSAPLVLSVLGGVTASWDGLFTDGVLPLDWSRTEVHASPEDGFTPSAVTLQSTIETAQGATVVVPTDAPVYVRFVARSTSGTASAPSAQSGPYGPEPVVAADLLDGTVTTVKLADDAVTAAKVAVGAVDSTAIQDGAVLEVALHDAAVSTGKLATDAVTSPKLAANSVIAGKIAANAVTAATVAAGAITTDKLTVTGGANILTDPSFEGAYTAAIISGSSYATQDTTKGNGSPTSLRINAVSASPAYRSVQLTTLPVLPGDQIRLAVDYWVSADWAGTEVNLQIRWETAAGGIISYGKASTTSPVRDAWTALSGTYTAPATAAVARIRVESGNATAGTVWWDNASVRPVLPGTQIQDGAITTAKIVAGAVQTLQLDAESVNASKIAAGAVTTAKLDALAVTADKIAANTITAGKLAVGSVDATALKADAITGKTITGGTVTGATVQTATSGARVVLDTAMRLYNPDGDLLAEAVPNASALGYPNDAGFIVYNTVGIGRYWAQLSRGFIRFGKDGENYRWPPLIDHYLAGGTSVVTIDSGVLEGSGEEENQATISLSGTGAATGDHPRVTIAGSGIRDSGRADLAVTGALTAGSIRTGRVTITPTAANTPTSYTVTGLNMTGVDPRAVATPVTTLPGTQVLGVGCINATLSSVTIWLTRTNTSATGIDYIVIAS